MLVVRETVVHPTSCVIIPLAVGASGHVVLPLVFIGDVDDLLSRPDFQKSVWKCSEMNVSAEV